jgi:hypothetical protein
MLATLLDAAIRRHFAATSYADISLYFLSAAAIFDAALPLPPYRHHYRHFSAITPPRLLIA